MPGPILVLGLDPGALDAPARLLSLLAGVQVLAGGKRQLAAFPAFPGRRLPVTSPLDAVLDALDEARCQGLSVAVLADGDPLFFGLGVRLAQRFGPASLRFLPSPSAVQLAAARLGLPWAEAPVVSLHGRSDPAPLLAALSRAGRSFVYTDAENSPAAIGRLLHDLCPEAFALTVFEDLNTPAERVRRLAPDQAAALSFSPLNLVLAEEVRPRALPLTLGLPDSAFAAERGLITKAPIRAAGLAALALSPGHVLWDIGAGCGSVSVEAAALLTHGSVHALEQNPARLDLVRENLRRFGAWQVRPVLGQAPEALDALPDPDRVFLGGGLPSPGVLEAAFHRLKPGGVLVAHCILLDSLALARAFFEARGLPAEVTLIQAARSRPLAGDLRLEAMNPVFIVRAGKG
jgi:precorrin-6Y C5,15-methyltransferase (decarboxylating)